MILKKPLTAAVVCQILALMILAGGIKLFALDGLQTWQLLLIQGGLAALFSRPLGMAPWWLLLHLLLPIAIWLAVSWQLPPWIYLVAFLITLLVFWNSAGERVPLYLSNHTTWQALDELLPKQQNLRFLDLGSGLAGTLRYLAEQHPEGKFVGVESAPLPMILARWRCRSISNINLLQEDMWQHDLSQYDVVYCFLSPEPMAKLYVKAKKEMREGALFISNSFSVPGAESDVLYELSDRRRTRLFLWKM